MPTATKRAAPLTKTAKSAKAKGAPKSDATRRTLAEVMAALEKAGTAQTKKTYARHGATEPMFGTSFATLGALRKKIGVDHDLAVALWKTGNFDAKNLAYKIADPKRFSADDLDAWALANAVRMCAGYVCMLAQESGNGLLTAKRWLASPDERLRSLGWGVVSQLAWRDESVQDTWLAERLADIEKTIHAAPNGQREEMNHAVIMIGGRSPALKKAALAAAKRIGKVEVDHGDTSCKTPDAAAYIEKTWAHATAKGYDSPSAQERDRETPRTRC